MKKALGLTTLSLSAPLIANAQELAMFFDDLTYIVGLVFPVIISLAVLFLLWGLAQYILKTGDVEGREGARDKIIWGIIAIFVMTSIWGLVNLLGTFVDLDSTRPPNVLDEEITFP